MYYLHQRGALRRRIGGVACEPRKISNKRGLKKKKSDSGWTPLLHGCWNIFMGLPSCLHVFTSQEKERDYVTWTHTHFCKRA